MTITMSLANGIGASAATGDQLVKQLSAVTTARAVIWDSWVDMVRCLSVRHWMA